MKKGPRKRSKRTTGMPGGVRRSIAYYAKARRDYESKCGPVTTRQMTAEERARWGVTGE